MKELYPGLEQHINDGLEKPTESNTNTSVGFVVDPEEPEVASALTTKIVSAARPTGYNQVQDFLNSNCKLYHLHLDKSLGH